MERHIDNKRELSLLALAVMLAGAAPGSPVDQLDRRLLHSNSATATLQETCSWRGDSRILARPSANRPEPGPPVWVRAALQAGRDEPVQYRRVELLCGEQVLSEADNWYLPARLTPSMNHALLTTPTPFGVAASAMGFHRVTLARVKLGGGRGLLRHRAVLIDRGGHAFSVVQETYLAAALDR